MNPHTASLDECRDYIAECQGYYLANDGQWCERQKGGVVMGPNPIEPTLDAAAGCLPPGWRWRRIEYVSHASCGCKRDAEYMSVAECPIGDPPSWISPETQARDQDMKVSMFRAAAIAWKTVKEKETPQ